MLQDIWLTRSPEQFARRFPAWYWLYFEISELRISQERACITLDVDHAFLEQCERIPAAIHPKAGTYNLLDLVAMSAIAQARNENLPHEFLIRHVLDWSGLAWQALVGAISGRDIWIAIIPEKNAYYGPYFLAEDFKHPADATPINLGRSVRRIFLENKWPRISTVVTETGSWNIQLEGSGSLLLEKLPPEGEDVGWPAKSEEPWMSDFRQLTSKNILEVDPIYRATPMWSDDPVTLNSRIAEAIDEVLAVNLDSRVPLDIRQMFEVMKGALAYGFFYRPLTTFAASQVYSIEDAALHHRCKLAGITPPKEFHRRIEALLRAGIIPPYEANLWHTKRQLRNDVAHRTHQWLLWPGMDFSTVELAALDINSLFVPIFAEASDSPLNK